MSRVAVTLPPAEHDLLCEGCGYTLNGLPDHSNCPECGKPIVESTGVGRREPPAWETAQRARVGAFIETSAQVLLRPTHFYRTLATRRDEQRARTFARIYWVAATVLFGLAANFHARLFFDASGFMLGYREWGIPFVLPTVVAYATLALTTALAARLTHWEATYRGLRLPLPVVRRGLDYHAAHYLPVALVAAATVISFMTLFSRGALGVEWYTRYLYILCAEVVLAAFYLFKTYWTAMRNMMYANR